MFKGVLVWSALIIFPVMAVGETSHLPSNPRSRPVFGEQGASGILLDPCFPGRLAGGQVSPPALTNQPSDNAREGSIKPESVGKDNVSRKVELNLLRRVNVAFKDEADCEKQIEKMEDRLQVDFNGVYQCELRGGGKILARETNAGYCAPTAEKSTFCSDDNLKDLLKTLAKYACRSERVIEKTERIVCESTDDMIYQTIRYQPRER